MSILKIQYPANSEEDNAVHQSVYPVFYTATSDEYTETGFKYNFELVTSDGVISSTKNPPRIGSGAGVYNPNTILQNLFDVWFQPKINGYQPCYGMLVNYRVDVTESAESISSPDKQSYTKALALRCNKENFASSTNILGGVNGEFLTDWTTTRKVNLLSEWGTVRFFNGVVNSSTQELSRIWSIRVEVLRDGITHFYDTWNANPFYNKVQSTDDNNLLSKEQLGPYVLDFQVCPNYLNTVQWKYVGYTTSNGTWVPLGTYKNGTILYEGDKYSIYAYTWPYGRGSQKLNFEVDSTCGDVKPIQLQWENKYGGFDFFTFRKTSTKSLDVESSTFRKSKYSLDGDNQMRYETSSRGEKVYSQDIQTNWTINTDWLTREEILDLEDLWTSKNVFALIDSTYYPVISLENAKVINSNVRGLRQYNFSFRLSNKKYV